jgi:DNA repair protein RadC
MIKTNERVAEIEVSYRPAVSSKPVIKTSFDAYNQFIEFFSPDTISLQETFYVMYLNRRNRVLGIYELSKGGITGTVVDIRLLLSVALKVAATAIILCHNHPSGNITPSKADADITSKVKQAASLFDISVADHIIISPERKYYSFVDEGML